MTTERKRVTHPKCGKSWVQRGNLTGHCAKCCETFEGARLFDRHQKINSDGSVRCIPPQKIKLKVGFTIEERDGSWREIGPEGWAEAVFKKRRTATNL